MGETPNAPAPAPHRRSFLDRLAASGHQSPRSNMDKELPAVPAPDPTDGGEVAPEVEGTAGMPERSRSFFDRFGAWSQQNATTEAASAAPASDITSHDGVSTQVDSNVGAPQRSKSRLDRVAAWGHPNGNYNRTKVSATAGSPPSTAGMTDDSYGASSAEAGTSASVPQRTQSRLDRWANLGHKESSRSAAATTAPISDAGFTDHDTAGEEARVGVPQRTRSRLDRFADLGHRDGGGGGWRSPTSVNREGSGVAPSTTVGDLGHGETVDAETNVSYPQRSPSFLDRLAAAGHRDTRRTKPIAAVVEESRTGVETSAAASSPTYSQGGSHAGVEGGVEVPQRKPSILDRFAASGHQHGKRKATKTTGTGAVTGQESTAGVTDSAPTPAEVEVNADAQQQGSWFGWMTGAGAAGPPPATAGEAINVQPTTAETHSDDGVTDMEVGANASKPQRRSWLDRIAASGHREGERSRTSKALPAVPAADTTATTHDRHHDTTELEPNSDVITAAGPDTSVAESRGNGGGFKRRLDRILPPQKTRGWFGRRAPERGEKALPTTPAGEQ